MNPWIAEEDRPCRPALNGEIAPMTRAAALRALLDPPQPLAPWWERATRKVNWPWKRNASS